MVDNGRSPWLFLIGVTAVTIGVVAHMPMFWMGRDIGFRMAGMPMDGMMIAGMALIVAGIGVAAWGLLPANLAQQVAAADRLSVSAPEDAPLSAAHWRLMAALVVALIIDIMKPASLGFVIPGMMDEYGLSRETVSLVPFAALAGTVTGSIVWGAVADVYGRKATILLSAVMFVGTSVCGTMPSLAWNIVMCFMMGAAAGGMLPVTYALLAEMMPSRHRGWSLVLVGGLGAAGGYVAASLVAAWLEPLLSWRILWLVNLPSGLILVALGVFIPESAKFLVARGRHEEARRIMARFGSSLHMADRGPPRPRRDSLQRPDLAGSMMALNLTAIAWSLVNFGLLLWLPAELVARGYSMTSSSRLLADSALVALPTVVFVAWIYHAWSTKLSLFAASLATLAGLGGMLWFALAENASPFLPAALLIIGSNAIIAMLLPYSAESFPLRVRGRNTGWVAASSKLGGVCAQGLAIFAIVPSLAASILTIMPVMAASLVLLARYGRETRGSDLRDLDPEGHVFDKAGL
ncbi:MFS transporter [Sphingopyxis alaskensis]|jgi:MFS transporter, putative metabolite:H+ symporter|uniref:Major facilitator superfamily MFS_1 n=2 Tax=Sphingopyxis alaskensis TaxID=117207 RepID=Q1GSZ9_SPHAL|nr:MFS transporter [Sphingopyxis alaskensis]ABF53223.1 major facilitator superfamily MFS_1 [Sphingopyxis alaskensis RB2256]MCM3418642.1 MFS transporter [Sphingopyxis alaskensis]